MTNKPLTLAEAIRLGSLTIKPMKGATFFGNDSGCAWGMAYYAAGAWGFHEVNSKGIKFPVARLLVPLPCKCVADKIYVDGVIIHLFDLHVMSRGNWTLDQLCDWVASVERDWAAKQPAPEARKEEPNELDEPVEETPEVVAHSH